MAKGEWILMKEIIHLALRTEYSFKNVYGHLKKTIDDYSENGIIGLADDENTHSFSEIERYCNGKEEIKTIFGIRLKVSHTAIEKIKPRGSFGREYLFIAKNQEGIKELYALVKINYQNFYYRGNISPHDVDNLSENVFVISKNPLEEVERLDYIAVCQSTPEISIGMIENGVKCVAIVDNYYPRATDKNLYQIFTSPRNTDNKTFPQHILSTKDFFLYLKRKGVPENIIEKSINATHEIGEICEKVALPKAPMVKYDGKETIRFLCRLRAKKLGIDLKFGEYSERFEYELKLIEDFDFQDYFLVVAKIVSDAKKKMLVGPSRGSCAGSLVCYLLRITEIDPVEYGLIFERFIDVTRSDLPDIDIDFPDTKRDSVVKNMVALFGEDNVSHVATISKMKTNISINEWGKSLKIPKTAIEEIKESLVNYDSAQETRSGSNAGLEYALSISDVAKDFFKKYPKMTSLFHIENHARHSGVHAAGVIVCNENISNFAGVNVRDGSIMCEKHGAEYLNLLKIDILGLRTLSVLEDCCKQTGIEFNEMYHMDYDLREVFEIFIEGRLDGIFQFEGYSLKQLTKKMEIERFNDIVAITSLGRPGALYSGAAGRYIKRRNGEEDFGYISEAHKEVTEETYGTIVFQEQMLMLCRKVSNMGWDDVNAIRKGISKSKGKEYLAQYKEKFVDGGIKFSDLTKEEMEFLWSEIEESGAYAFNKSHAVAYAMISYWTAYFKAKYPLEFVVANLRNCKNPESAIKILRDATIIEGIQYCPVDVDESDINWSVSNGVVVGGLTNIKGIGVANARKIIDSRNGGKQLTPAMIKKLIHPKTEYDVLFPTKHYWGDIFERPNLYGLAEAPVDVINIQGKEHYTFIGKLKSKNIRDLNEYANVQRRGGKILESNSLSFSMTIEDDTDIVMCNINRFNFEEIGREIAESGVVDVDWFILKGEIRWEGRYVDVTEIIKLDESMLEKEK